MRKSLAILLIGLSAIVNAQVDDKEIVFESVSYDFGTVKFGDQKINATYIFTNKSPIDFQIKDVKASCGCTVPEYPKNLPIAPGATGEIRVSFDSSNKPNLQQKTVTITANTDTGRETIRIKAMVTADPVKQQQREAAQAARLQQTN